MISWGIGFNWVLNLKNVIIHGRYLYYDLEQDGKDTKEFLKCVQE